MECNRRQNTTRDRRQREVRGEVFILCGVVIVTFRVLSWFVVMKRYSYSKIVLQLIVVLPAEYPINSEPINYFSHYRDTRDSIASSTKQRNSISRICYKQMLITPKP
jgi:hypothetical protein